MIQAFVSTGVSGAARYIADTTQEYRLHMHKSSKFGIESVLRADLAEAWGECQEADWDGYGALPVTRAALRNMYRFLEALPFGCRRPTIGADPNGYLSVEWYRNPKRVLSVALSDDDLLHYAALLGASKVYGTEAFYGEAPESILDLVRRVYS